jgi:hypothetical protein
LSVYRNARLSGLTVPSLSMAGSIDINLNPLLSEIDVSALQTVSGDFNINVPILDILKAYSLRNATGSIYVSRCLQPDFSSLVDALFPPLSICGSGLGNIFAGKNAVVCVPCQPGFYKGVQSNENCTLCPQGQTSNAESSSCLPTVSSCALVSIPDYGCVSSLVPVNAVPGNGNWSCLNASVSFENYTTGNTTLTSTSAGNASITWTALSGNCTISKTITIVGPIVAQIPTPTGTMCGSTGSVYVVTELVGDALFGNWTSNFGSFKNSKTSSTLFSWNQPGTVFIRFAPNSVCPTPANLSFVIAAECPPEPLSREATIGIAVGATLGSLILIAVGVVLAIWLYRVWNRSLVKFRSGNDVALSTSQYKF